MKQLKTIPFNQRHLKRTLNFRKPHSVLYRMWYAHLNLDDRHPTKTTLPKVYTCVCVCVCYGGFRGGQSQKPIATIQPNNKETCRPVGTWSSVLGNRTHIHTHIHLMPPNAPLSILRISLLCWSAGLRNTTGIHQKTIPGVCDACEYGWMKHIEPHAINCRQTAKHQRVWIVLGLRR